MTSFVLVVAGIAFLSGGVPDGFAPLRGLDLARSARARRVGQLQRYAADARSRRGRGCPCAIGEPCPRPAGRLLAGVDQQVVSGVNRR
jgi:hypothetical protein